MSWLQTMPVRWRVTLFLFMAAGLNYADRAALSSVIPPLRGELGATDVDIGLIGSLFLWCYAICSPIAGNCADRFSRSAIITWSLGLWSLVTLATGFISNVTGLLVLRVLLGAVESLYLPAAAALLGDHHSRATRGKAMGLHMTGLTLGVVVGGAFAGTIAEHWGWRWGFRILGAGGIGLALVSLGVLKDAPPTTSPRPGAAAIPGRAREALRYLARTPSFHVMLFSTMAVGTASWIFFAWLPLYFRESHDLRLGAAGLIGTAVFQGPSVVGIILGGWLSDRAARHRPQNRMLLKALSFLLSAPFLLFLLGRPALGLVVSAVCLSSLIRTMGGANEHPIICDITPTRFRSSAFGILNMCGTAAGGCGILLSGILKDYFGLSVIFAGFSLLFIPAGIAVLVAYSRFMPRDITRAQAFDANPASPATAEAIR